MFSKAVLSSLITFLIIFYSIFNFTGCSDTTSPVNPTSFKSVSGNITGLGSLPLANYTVSIGNKSAQTDINGNFVINDIEFPYHLVIKSTDGNKNFVYQNLNTGNLNLKLNVITYPAPIGRLRFNTSGLGAINGKFIFSDGERISTYSGFLGGIEVLIPEGGSVTGDLFIFTYRTNQQNKIEEYYKFGKIPNVTIAQGSNERLDITPEMLTHDISSRVVNVSSNKFDPGDVLYFYVSFSDWAADNYFNQLNFGVELSNPGSFLIPENIPVPYSIVVGMFHSHYADQLTKTIEGASSNVSIEVPQKPLQILPDYNSTVDLNSEFSFTSAQFKTIKKVTIFNEVRSIEFFSLNNNFTLSELINLGVELPDGDYKWTITTIGIFDSMNQYVSIIPLGREIMNSIQTYKFILEVE